MKRPQIGQVCTIKATASKHHTWAETALTLKSHRHYPHLTQWGHNVVKPFKAHYIGYRVVSEGATHLEIDGDGEWRIWSYPVYTPSNHRVVWVFVESEKHNPFYAFPEDVTKEIESSPE